MATRTLRPYPNPGKFEGGLIIDQLAYTLSLDGADDECGSVEEGCWHGQLCGPFKSDGAFADVSATARLDLELTADELAYLAECAGCIVTENDQGFVSVQWFDAGQDEALLQSWDDAVAHHDNDDSDESDYA